jgi:phosphatidylserine decarboxylase
MSALTYATAQLLRVLPRERVTRAMGRLADRRWSAPVGRAVVALYSRVYKVEFADCCETSWTSFDSFFTRSLRDGTRPVDPDPRAIVSPADGRLASIGPIDESSTLVVKGQRYRLDELVGDPTEARRYAGGQGAVVYLSPRDYHRVHAPVGGYVRRIRSMPGDYYPVNAVGERHVKNLLARNRRVAITIDTPDPTGIGRVTVVMVAAIVVGRVTVTGIKARDVPFGDHFFDPPLPLERGQELGVFHLGSTAVLLLEKGASVNLSAAGGSVRVGQRIGSREQPVRAVAASSHGGAA